MCKPFILPLPNFEVKEKKMNRAFWTRHAGYNQAKKAHDAAQTSTKTDDTI